MPGVAGLNARDRLYYGEFLADLVEFRARHSYTRDSLSRDSGLDRDTIMRLEHGRQVPRARTILGLMRAAVKVRNLEAALRFSRALRIGGPMRVPSDLLPELDMLRDRAEREMLTMYNPDAAATAVFVRGRDSVRPLGLRAEDFLPIDREKDEARGEQSHDVRAEKLAYVLSPGELIRYKRFCQAVVDMRHNLDLTRAQAEEKFGLSRTTLGNYERGISTPNPSVAARLAALARELGQAERIVQDLEDAVHIHRKHRHHKLWGKFETGESMSAGSKPETEDERRGRRLRERLRRMG
jgi:transcriptional regulator with XRE-family HTH domain